MNQHLNELIDQWIDEVLRARSAHMKGDCARAAAYVRAARETNHAIIRARRIIRAGGDLRPLDWGEDVT